MIAVSSSARPLQDAVSSDATAWPRVAAAGLPVPLDAHRDNVGITGQDTLCAGALNVWGNSLAAEHLPSGGPVVVGGVRFTFPDSGAGVPDNVRCAGQFVAVPPGRYDWIYLLATAERRVEDDLVLHFENGAVDLEPLRISDFWAAVAAFGEPAAFRSPVMHYRRHVQDRVPGTIWMPRVPVTRPARLTGIRLPRNIAIHVFAVTGYAGPARPAGGAAAAGRR